MYKAHTPIHTIEFMGFFSESCTPFLVFSTSPATVHFFFLKKSHISISLFFPFMNSRDAVQKTLENFFSFFLLHTDPYSIFR